MNVYFKDINSKGKFSLKKKKNHWSYPRKDSVDYYTSLRRIKIVDSSDFPVASIYFYTVVNI